MSMGSGIGPVWRHMRTDRGIGDQKLAENTVRRVFGFARPHRRPISMFLGLTVVDAALVVVTPLLVKRIVDDGILQAGRGAGRLARPGHGRGGGRSTPASPSACGWLSSRIGEGLIYDLRTQVFAHVQRMSLAFFTRTQTGALVSRLNNDVIGAQRAFTSTLSSTVVQHGQRWSWSAPMFLLSWQVTPALPG